MATASPIMPSTGVSSKASQCLFSLTLIPQCTETAEGETTTHFENFHAKVGTAPVLSTDTAENIAAYKTVLEEARTLLQTAYGFDADNASNW